MVTYTMLAPLLGWLVVGLLLFGPTGSVIAESTDITVRVIARTIETPATRGWIT